MTTLTRACPPSSLQAMPASGPPRRAVFADARGHGLRATWHAERDEVVLSLWRDDVCTGTFRLPGSEVARLAEFLDAHAAGRDDVTTVVQRANHDATTRLVGRA